LLKTLPEQLALGDAGCTDGSGHGSILHRDLAHMHPKGGEHRKAHSIGSQYTHRKRRRNHTHQHDQVHLNLLPQLIWLYLRGPSAQTHAYSDKKLFFHKHQSAHCAEIFVD
jgi:hypothetical protein